MDVPARILFFSSRRAGSLQTAAFAVHAAKDELCLDCEHGAETVNLDLRPTGKKEAKRELRTREAHSRRYVLHYVVQKLVESPSTL